MVIPVVVAADSNYTIPMIVTIGSILLSAKKETTYQIIIITDNLFQEEKVAELKKKFFDFQYTIYRIEEQQLQMAVIRNEGLTMFTYARLFIPRFLKDFDKCIYLDTDVVVLEDLTELFAFDMEPYYVAGVKDYGVQMAAKDNSKIRKVLSIDSMDSYVNAGVLLMNLRKMREEHIDVACMELIGKKWRYEDQDIINKCCYGEIGILPIKYNVLYRYYQRSEFWEEGFYPKEDMRLAQEKPAILHYTGKNMKPWKYFGSRAAYRWWNAAKNVLTGTDYQNVYGETQKCWAQMQWRYIKEKCRQKKVIIWGFSEKGELLYEWLKNNGIEVECFCDSDREKKGIYIEKQIEVRTIEEITEDTWADNYIYVIASQGYFLAIEKILRQWGKKEYVRFFYKSEFYYMALDESQYERELREIEEKEKVKYELFTEKIKKRYWLDKWYDRRRKEMVDVW